MASNDTRSIIMERHEKLGIFEILQAFQEKISTELDQTLKTLMMGRQNLMDATCQVETEKVSRTKELVKETKEIELGHIKDIHKRNEETNDKISINISKIHKQIQDLNIFIKSWKEKLQFSSEEMFNKLASKCKDEIQQYSLDIPIMPLITVPKFNFLSNKEALENVYGTIDHIPLKYSDKGFQLEKVLEQNGSDKLKEYSGYSSLVDQGASQINVKVVSSFKCSSYDGPTLAANDGKSVLIGSDDDTFSLIGQDGNIITSVNPRFRVRQATVLPSGDFLIACGLKTRLVKLYKDGKIEAFYNTKPFNPYRISVSDRGHILVCLTACVEDSQVIKLSLSGEKLQTYACSEDDNPLFEDPGFLLENINGDIWVQDQGYVTVIQDDNKSCFKYAGAPGKKTANLFTPAGLACNKLGQVIIADNANSDIHLIDMDGRFIQYLITNQHELRSPYALSIDTEGKLWIGCEKRSEKNIFVIKYLSD